MSERNSIGSNYSNSSNYSDSSFSSDGEDDLSTDQVQLRNNQQDVNETLHHSRKSNIARHIVLTVITGFTYLIGLGIYSIYRSVKARRVNQARLAENNGLQFNRTNQQIRQQNQVRRATLRQSQPNLQQWTYTLYQARSSINMHDPSSTNLKQSETGLFSKIANNYKNSSFNQVKNQDFAQIFKNSTLQTQVTNLMNDFIENQSKEKIDRLINNYFENDHLENLSDEQRRNLLMFCAQQELNNSHSRQLLNSATLTHGAFLKQFEALLNCVLVSHADNLDEAEQLDTKQSLINNALNWKVNPNQVKLSQANQNIISDLQDDDSIIRSASEDQIFSTKQDSIIKTNEDLKPGQENGNKISSNLDEQINADEEAIVQQIGEQQGTIYNTGNMTRREYQKIIAEFKQPSSHNLGQETLSSQTTVQLKPQSAPAPKLNLETIRQQYLKGDVYLSKLNDADLPSMQAVLTQNDQKVLNNLSPNGQTYEDIFIVNKNLYYGLNHIFQAILASQVESFNPIKTVLQNNGIKPAANNSMVANQLMSLVINKLKDEGKLAALFDHQATGIELYKLVSTKALELVEPIIYDDNNDSETNNSISKNKIHFKPSANSILREPDEDDNRIISSSRNTLNLRSGLADSRSVRPISAELINDDEKAILQAIGYTGQNIGQMTRDEYQRIIADYTQRSSGNQGQDTGIPQTTVQTQTASQSVPENKLSFEAIEQQYLKGDVYLSKLDRSDLPAMQAVLTTNDQKVLNSLSGDGTHYEDIFSINQNLAFGLNHIFQAILASQHNSFDVIKTVLIDNDLKPSANNSMVANQLMSLVINKLKDEGKLAELFGRQTTGIELYKLVSAKALQLIEPLPAEDQNVSSSNSINNNPISSNSINNNSINNNSINNKITNNNTYYQGLTMESFDDDDIALDPQRKEQSFASYKQRNFSNDVYMSQLNSSDLNTMQSALNERTIEALNQLGSEQRLSFKRLFDANASSLVLGLLKISDGIVASLHNSYDEIEAVLRENGYTASSNNPSNLFMAFVIIKLKEDGSLDKLLNTDPDGLAFYKLVSAKAKQLLKPYVK